MTAMTVSGATPSRLRVVRLSGGSAVSLSLFAALAVALGIGVASLGPDLPQPSAFIEQLASEDDGSTEVAVEGERGYSFSHPAGWEVRTEGAVSTVSSPNRRMVVSVGPGPEGTLEQTSEAFIELVQSQYRGVSVSSSANGSVADGPALITSATATNERGLKVRLFAIAMDPSGGPYVVAGFSDAAAVEATTLRQRVRQIAESFETGGS